MLLTRLGQHPSLVRIHDAYANVEYKSKHGNYFTHALVLECCLQSLQEFVERTGPFPEAFACAWFHKLLDGLSHCHQQGIAHRDLKPEQILFSVNLECRISDFNFGVDVTRLPENENPVLAGTQLFMAPEVYSVWASRIRLQQVTAVHY